MVPFEREIVSSYRSSIIIVLLRVSEILPLLCCSTPLLHLLLSSKFPLVPLGVGGWPLAYEERS